MYVQPVDMGDIVRRWIVSSWHKAIPFYCICHGGGHKCKMTGCHKVARGKLVLCMGHATATNKEPQL